MGPQNTPSRAVFRHSRNLWRPCKGAYVAKFFHVNVQIRGKKSANYYLNDLPKQKVIDEIVFPYLKKVTFIFDGYVVNPADVDRLKIAQTDEPAKSYVDAHNARMRKQGIVDFATNLDSLAVEKGTDVTTTIIGECNRESGGTPRSEGAPLRDQSKVFVIHGHDGTSLHQLCRIMKDDLGLTPVVLSEQPNEGLDTIISKFERVASDCATAIALFTPDDKTQNRTLARARQNVIFELGYFLGRDSQAERRQIVILVKKGNDNVDIPSDIAGVAYYAFQNDVTEVFYGLTKQFEIWGVPGAAK